MANDSVVSLFSGAGGFSLGFSSAGLRPLFGAEINEDACASYEANIGSNCHLMDLGRVDVEDVASLAGGSRPFAIIGGPPCQGFSTAGARTGTDPRNLLIYNYLSIVGRLRPRWFVFENVEGLLTSNDGNDIARLVQEFISLGYSVRLEKVNFAAYGVPQTRKRVIIIGNSIGASFEFPEETFSYNSGKFKKASSLPLAPTLDHALSGLGMASNTRHEVTRYTGNAEPDSFDAKMRSGNPASGVTFHYAQSAIPRRDIISLLKPGQTMKDLPPELWHASYRRRANRRVSDGVSSEKRGGAPSGIKRLCGNLQSLTITGSATREFIHPKDDRPLTIRECARLQTFPDSFQWVGTGDSVIQQIGNAVPPIASEVIARHLMALDGQFGGGMLAGHEQCKPRLLGFKLTEAAGMSPALKKTHKLLTSYI